MRKSIYLSASGIYSITNITNGKRYIGSTRNIIKRRSSHICNLRKNKHPNQYLQRAWNKYNEASFTFEVLEYCEPANLLVVEDYYLDWLETHKREFGYNLNQQANRPIPSYETRLKMSASQKGKILSQETKEKISRAFTGTNHPFWGKKFSKIHRQRLSESHLGAQLTEEHKAKIGTASRGRKHTLESRIKMSLSQKALFTEERRAKISQMNQGRKHTNITRLHMSEAHQNQQVSETTKQKISLKLKGKPKPPRTIEHSRKISETLKRKNKVKRLLKLFVVS